MTLRQIAYVLGFCLVATTGCGENGPPPGAPLGTPSPVHGRVTFADGTPVKGGLINFFPLEIEVGRKLRYDGASLIDANGQYKLGRNLDGQGVVPGEYIVTVIPREVGELPGSNSSRVPMQFQEKATSTIKITVEEKDNVIDIVLK